jgi:hypothetical protein
MGVHLTHSPRCSIGCAKMISEPIARSVQTVHLSCIEINTMSKWTKTSFHLTHVTKEFHQVCSKWFSSLWNGRPKPCTYLALILTVSPNRPKWASTWHNSPVSSIGCPHNNFPANCTFELTQRIETSFHLTHVMFEFNRVCPKRIPSLLRVQRKQCTFFASRLTLSQNGTKWASIGQTSPRSSIGCVQNNFHDYAMFISNCAPILCRD